MYIHTMLLYNLQLVVTQTIYHQHCYMQWWSISCGVKDCSTSLALFVWESCHLLKRVSNATSLGKISPIFPVSAQKAPKPIKHECLKTFQKLPHTWQLSGNEGESPWFRVASHPTPSLPFSFLIYSTKNNSNCAKNYWFINFNIMFHVL